MDVRLEHIEAAYTFLQTLYRPFQKLPPAEEVEFHVIENPKLYGDYSQWIECRDNAHIIRISTKRHAHLATLLQTVAHEMLHALQNVENTYTPQQEHNADFYARGARIARRFGWDEKAF